MKPALPVQHTGGHGFNLLKKSLAENNITSADTIIIKDLTPLGHDFIANVREEENYNSLKSKAKRAGVESVKALITIGEEVAASAITKVLTGQG